MLAPTAHAMWVPTPQRVLANQYGPSIKEAFLAEELYHTVGIWGSASKSP
ncbi:MAG: hypothetical protein ACK5HO_00520 [Pseudomonadota bacterium]